MPNSKVTLIMETSLVNSNNDPNTPAGAGGWSENYYAAAEIGAALHEKCKALIFARTGLMSTQAYCRGYRIQHLDAAGKSISVKYTKFGRTNLKCDNPEQALSWTVRSSTSPNRHVLTLRGVPDARVEGGVYKSLGTYEDAMKALFVQLLADPWRFRGKVLTGAKARLTSISGGGVLTFRDAWTEPVGTTVQILRSYAAGHRAKGIETKTLTSADGQRLESWPYGASVGGTIRKVMGYDYFANELTPEEIVNPEVRERQTGGPIRRSRGRRSARYV